MCVSSCSLSVFAMKTFRIIRITLLQALLLYHSALANEQKIIIGELGKSVLLPCLDAPLNTTLTETRWLKDDLVLVTHDQTHHGETGHFSILDNGSLNISGLMTIDDAVYQCDPQPRTGNTSQEILLQVTDGPTDLRVSAKPAKSLPNGTWTAVRGSNVSFKCTSKSYPSQSLSWAFGETRRGFDNTTLLEFAIMNVQLKDQGNYTCTAQNLVTKKHDNQILELLIYYPPVRHPDCIWHMGDRLNQIFFNCSWYGGYPTPTLKVYLESSSEGKPTLAGSQETENFELSLNRSMLYQGQKITCVGEHVAQKPGEEKNCTFTLELPYPDGDPMVAVLEGNNVTLRCSELISLPPAKTAWLRGINREVVSPSWKYALAEQGPSLTLTIINVSKEDEGVFFCRSENVLGAKELEVYLTVRSSVSSGAVVGVFISLLVVVAGGVLGYFLYSRRDRICLGFQFGHLHNDRVDEISLVESDDDEIFHDAVPRLPSLANGHSPAHPTTTVEIHCIRSTDHEDNMNDIDQDKTQDQMQLDEES